MKLKNKMKAENKKTFCQYYDQVEIYLTGLKESDPEEITFDQLRNELNLSESQLPDGHIHQIAIDLDFEVEP